ncbi:SPOC like C-terminal domain-containing protein [Cladochytrium replicatum]|nr:SPOC like C-terminal domain-containing protein [Cladochytrium replicatum]
MKWYPLLLGVSLGPLRSGRRRRGTAQESFAVCRHLLCWHALGPSGNSTERINPNADPQQPACATQHRIPMSSSYSQWTQDGEEEEEEDFGEVGSEEPAWTKREGVLWVIDCTKTMHIPSFDPAKNLDDDDENSSTAGGKKKSPFQLCMEVIAGFLKNKIIIAETDLAGVVLYGTEKARNALGFQNIYVLYDLDQPDVHRIIDCEKLGATASGNISEFGSSDTYNLGEVLWACSTLFSNTPQKVGAKRIFLVTGEDRPHSEDKEKLKQAKVRAADLQDLKITIELFPFDLPDRPKFDADRFFGEIIRESEDGSGIAAASSKFEHLTDKIRRKEVQKRSAFRIPFHIGEGLTIGVRGYNMFVEAKKGNHTYLEPVGNKEVKTVTTYVCEDTGQILMASDFKYFYKFGVEESSKVVFTKEEVAEIKSFGDPGLTLLGFKPLSCVKPHHMLKHSVFIAPDEGEYTGSISLFAHLLSRLAERNKVAICNFVPRRASAPRLVALVPQSESLDTIGEQIPPGFHVIPLPFADDLRAVPAPTSELTVADEHVMLAGQVISKLLIRNYDPTNYENPVLQKHYANLQTVALGRDAPIASSDHTLPKTETIHARAGNLIKQFLEVALDGEAMELTPATKKRERASVSGESKAKKPKVEAGSVSTDNFKKLAAEGKLASLTVPVLTEFAKSNGLKVGRKKADIIEAIEDFLTTQ